MNVQLGKASEGGLRKAGEISSPGALLSRTAFVKLQLRPGHELRTDCFDFFVVITFITASIEPNQVEVKMTKLNDNDDSNNNGYCNGNDNGFGSDNGFGNGNGFGNHNGSCTDSEQSLFISNLIATASLSVSNLMSLLNERNF